jgi:hypothetical protein
MPLQFGAGNVEVLGEAVVLAPSAARGVTGNGSSIDTGERGTLRLLLDITVVSGTSPTITVSVEQSHNGTTWRAHSSFAAATAVSSERKSFGGIDRYVRATWTIGGTTPSFTFAVTGTAI